MDQQKLEGDADESNKRSQNKSKETADWRPY